MEDVRLNDEIKHHWRMVFEGNDCGVDNEKVFIHAKRRYVYMNNKKSLKRGYFVEVLGYDLKKVLW